MKFTGDASHLPPHPKLSQDAQEDTILRIAAEIGVPATFLAAIRIAEGGGPGREFGVLSEDATSYEEQCRVAALSVRNNQFRYALTKGLWPTGKDGTLSEDFVEFMAKRWAPVGASNDPQGLNRHWPANVARAYRGSGVA